MKAFCEKHYRAYLVADGCDYCQPEPVAKADISPAKEYNRDWYRAKLPKVPRGLTHLVQFDDCKQIAYVTGQSLRDICYQDTQADPVHLIGSYTEWKQAGWIPYDPDDGDILRYWYVRYEDLKP